MESKFINRYHTFCKNLKNLEKSLKADPKADFGFRPSADLRTGLRAFAEWYKAYYKC